MDKINIGIVVSKFNHEITSNLLKGAEHALGSEIDAMEIIEEWSDKKSSAATVKTNNRLAGKEVMDITEEFVRLHATMETKIIEVPGSFELPVAAKWLANDKVDGIIALGAIIKGATSHNEHLATASAQGLMQVGVDSGIPLGFGVITADSIGQAKQRSSLDFMQSSAVSKQQAQQSNKGYEAAQAVLEMLLARELAKANISIKHSLPTNQDA